MAFKMMIFFQGFLERFSVDVFHLVVAVWFFSVGYLMWKRLRRRAHVPTSQDAAGPLADPLFDVQQNAILHG